MSAIKQVKRIAVFASGSGSNFEAILAYLKEEGYLYQSEDSLYQSEGNQSDMQPSAQPQIEISLLVCDKPTAYALERAKQWAIPTLTAEPKQFSSKAAYEQHILDKLQEQKVELIVLAGYMRLIGPTLLEPYFGKIINIHPSLLPSFPGKDAIGQAIAKGVRVTGVTIHYVDPGMDTGPIIAQEPVSIELGETEESLHKKIQAVEHRLYPKTILECLKGQWKLKEGRVIRHEEESLN